MMVLDGVWGNSESVGIGDAFAISLIAILIVFLVLIIIILATSLVEKGSKFLLSKTTIMPKRENEIPMQNPQRKEKTGASVTRRILELIEIRALCII